MIQIYLTNIHHHHDSEVNEVEGAEPYVFVAAVNLGSFVEVGGFPVPLPAFEVVRYGPIGSIAVDGNADTDADTDADTGDRRSGPGAPRPFWGTDGNPAALVDPDRAIFVVALMENDGTDPESLRGIVKGIVGASVLGTLNLSRTDKVAALIGGVNSASGSPNGAPHFDARVGIPQELRFSRDDLTRAEAGQAVSRTLVFRDNGGRYTLTFDARNFI
jgi:hypothetical protein